MSKIKVSDYIAQLLVENNINTIFSVVGGMSMHLNNSFHYYDDIEVIYNHHEQASAIAAEGYYKARNKVACACVTSGPGGTNALTGVLCAYQDNIPMIVISGQVKTTNTIQSTGLSLRQYGEQENDIIAMVKHITKYSAMIIDSSMIKYHVEKAIYEATTGRKGPVWLDIPLDIQNTIIDTSEQIIFNIQLHNEIELIKYKDSITLNQEIQTILMNIEESKKPILICGSSCRYTNQSELYSLAEKLNIPILTSTFISDIFENDYKLYYGQFGVFGGREGNFIVQNSDLLIIFGCRMTFKHTGFDYKSFATNAKKIIIDIDDDELRKDQLNRYMKIDADLNYFIPYMNKTIRTELESKTEWIKYCDSLPSTKIKIEDDDNVNTYEFATELNKKLNNDSIVVVGNSTSSMQFLQKGINKQGQKLFGNINCGTMGYDLPAAIGACIASNKKEVICITGDGSIQMNLQELQTIVHNKLPIKIIVFNNNGYQLIVNTQNNFQNGKLSGCNKESGVSFPDMSKIAKAYDIEYNDSLSLSLYKGSIIENAIEWLFEQESYCILEIMPDNMEVIPKLKNKIDENGNFVKLNFNDLYPYLSEEEYNKYAKFDY
jgi:acetolactate synthase-1/2/3 large subunit